MVVKSIARAKSAPFATHPPQSYVGTGGTTAFYLIPPMGEQTKPDWETASTRWVSFDEGPDLIRLTQVIAGRKRDLQIQADARLLYESRCTFDDELPPNGI